MSSFVYAPLSSFRAHMCWGYRCFCSILLGLNSKNEVLSKDLFEVSFEYYLSWYCWLSYHSLTMLNLETGSSCQLLFHYIPFLPPPNLIFFHPSPSVSLNHHIFITASLWHSSAAVSQALHALTAPSSIIGGPNSHHKLILHTLSCLN